MHRIDMDKSYVLGIDIGSSNVVMAAGTLNENNEMSILAVDVQKIEDCVKDGGRAGFKHRDRGIYL